MELVYLWVEDYKNIHKQGFNFSPRFRCEYDGKTLTIDENNDYIPNFFGENINVTAIVGKNGSGKSSLLELILDIEHWTTSLTKLFFVVNNGKKLTLHHLNFNGDINCSSEIKQDEVKRTKESQIQGFPIPSVGLNFVYLSLSLFLPSINRFYTNTGVKFFSVYNYVDNYQNHSFKFDDFFLSMIPKIPTLLENKEVQILFEIKGKPNYLLIYIPKNFEKEFRTEFKKINEISFSNIEKDSFFVYKIDIDKIPLVIKQIKISKNKCESKLNFLEKEYSKVNGKIEQELQDSHDITKQFDYDRLYNVNKSLEVPLNIQKTACESRINDLNQILNIKYYFVNGDSSFFFSSGELVLLFYIDKLLQIAKNEKNITLLIDESELHLHPDWQKKFIHLLCNLLTHQTYKRNILITSHSPFLISDIPKENIIFMKDGKQVKGTDKKQTFGANIHTLLSDSFFIEDGLMGEFAKKKIDKVITILNQEKPEEKDLEYCEKIIPIIGEPIVKNQLQKMLDSKKLPKVGEIDKIHEEIEALQSRLKDLEENDDKK